MSIVRMPRRALMAMTVVLSFAAVLLPAAPALAAYSSSLIAPVPPGGSDTFSWTVGGAKSNPNKEISSAELSGCWTPAQVVSASATDADNNPLPVKVQAKGPRAGQVVVSNLSDARLPARLTLGFTARFGSRASGTTLVVQAGTGSSGKERLDDEP